ncbi:retrotransposon protein, putative, ty1-copia subclass [Tanacetum coccineum]
MVRCSYGLEAVIRTSWTNRNPSCRFYGCLTIVMGYDVVDECGFELNDGMNSFGTQALSKFNQAARSIACLFDMKMQRESQLATELNILTRQLVESIDERRLFIQELERLPGNFLAYKTREELKGLQKDDLIKVMKMRKPIRIIPSPVGVIQTAKLYKIADTREDREESIMSTQEYIRKVIEDVGEDDDFKHASWLNMLDYVNVDGGIVTGCFGDVKKILKNGKLEKVVAVIKSCTPNALSDLTVTLKDLSGGISDTIHYKVLTEERFAKSILVGSALILHNVSIFSPKQSTHHYLNITKKNMVKVFHKDRGLHSFYALNVAKSIFYDAYYEVACLILGSMTPELHRKFENSSPYDMIRELKSMVEKQDRVERFDLIQTFHACKQEEDKPVDISVGLILNGLTSDFAGFVRNYNMHNMGKTVGELHAMLIEYEKGLPKKATTPQVMAIQAGRIQKANKKSQNAKGKGKGKGKGKDKSYTPKPKNPKPSAKEHPAKDDACHHCKEVGHWKRNCLVYLAELIMKKKEVGTASSSGIFTIELFSFPKNSWVYDTGCGTHICNTKQGLRRARKLKQGALYLYVGNGVHAQVEAIRSYDLVLPNGLVICLDNFSKNDVLYFNAISSNGIYEIDMINRVLNVNSIYTVSNKRAKHNLDSTYLWHCRLAHISKKRKMTKKSFPHHTGRATNLLEIIHTDVCGPLRHMSRQGASYCITFTDDYSRYGYVYLLKHKHEVFKTFKVFKNEVENQLGKTIKALQSDRGDEYISQEFKYYLKACGIVQQLIPPYTPQHDGVSERRNRTLLDMVRSMMNLTTLPLSFWDYALETATRILNMVPTKKVDKTPYELWYGKVHNLSYLKVWGCEALMKRDTPDKLQQRSVKCIFIGYPKEMIGYYFYFPPENKTIVARYAEFLEKNLLSQEISRRAEELEEIQDEDTSPSENTSKTPMEVEDVDEYSLGDLNEPTNYKAAILDPESDKWVDAMNAEMQSMKDNKVWRLVDLPPNSKGFTQTYEVDYEETFSPVADIRAIRILIAISAFYDYEIWQIVVPVVEYLLLDPTLID